MSDIAWKYNSQKNKEEAIYPGIPLGDITEGEFKALPKWMQAQVKESGWYAPYEEEPEEKKAQAPDKGNDKPTGAKEN